MSGIIRLAERRARAGLVHFSRAELNQLLALYARHVAAGDWRDYAIAADPSRAAFSVFRSALDKPIYTVIKAPGHKKGDFLVAQGGRILMRCPTLSEALELLDERPRLRLVT